MSKFRSYYSSLGIKGKPTALAQMSCLVEGPPKHSNYSSGPAPQTPSQPYNTYSLVGLPCLLPFFHTPLPI